MQLTITGEREATLRRIANRLKLTPRQLILQAVDREIEGLEAMRKAKLKREFSGYGNYDNRSVSRIEGASF